MIWFLLLIGGVYVNGSLPVVPGRNAPTSQRELYVADVGAESWRRSALAPEAKAFRPLSLHTPHATVSFANCIKESYPGESRFLLYSNNQDSMGYFGGLLSVFDVMWSGLAENTLDRGWVIGRLYQLPFRHRTFRGAILFEANQLCVPAAMRQLSKCLKREAFVFMPYHWAWDLKLREYGFALLMQYDGMRIYKRTLWRSV